MLLNVINFRGHFMEIHKGTYVFTCGAAFHVYLERKDRSVKEGGKGGEKEQRKKSVDQNHQNHHHQSNHSIPRVPVGHNNLQSSHLVGTGEAA